MQVVQVDFPTHTIRYAGRALTCTRCGLVWDVIDFPVGHVKATTYVCPDHLIPVGKTGSDIPVNISREYSPGDRHLRVVA